MCGTGGTLRHACTKLGWRGRRWRGGAGGGGRGGGGRGCGPGRRSRCAGRVWDGVLEDGALGRSGRSRGLLWLWLWQVRGGMLSEGTRKAGCFGLDRVSPLRALLPVGWKVKLQQWRQLRCADDMGRGWRAGLAVRAGGFGA